MARMMLFGSTGQLGSDLARELAEHELLAYGPTDIDVTDAGQVQRAIAGARPEWILNATAYNDVARAESDPEPAFAVNAAAVWFMAREARAVGARLVHFSTDYVFGGDKPDAYVESDPPRPQNVYAASKLAGEYLAMQAETWFIFRLSALFGVAGCQTKPGGNFVERVLTQARAGDPLRVVDDVTATPTFSLDVARWLRERLFSLQPGLYHLANRGACTWHAFAAEILAQAGFSKPALTPIQSWGQARVPRNSAIASEKLPPLRPWREALAEYLCLRGAR